MDSRSPRQIKGPLRRLRFTSAVVVIPSALVLSQAASAGAHNRRPAAATTTTRPAPAAGGALSGSPAVPVADPSTHTLYVPIQCRQGFCANGKSAHHVDLINTKRCTSTTAHCHVVAEARVGSGPLAAALDAKRHTLYVAAGEGNHGVVSVVNTARCNVRVTRGCDRPVATIHTGGFLVAATFDAATDTLYLANGNGSVIVVDARHCDAAEQRGCDQRAHRVTDKAGPSGIAVDDAHSTMYVSNVASDGTGDTVTLIDTARCNSRITSGCSKPTHDVTVGQTPYWDTVDQRTDTVYVAAAGADAVSIIDARSCNATHLKGCPKVAKTVVAGGSVQSVIVDQKLHTVFTLNSNDDTVSALSTRTCRAGSLSKCPAVARSQQAASNRGAGFVNFPSAFTLIPGTSTLYAVSIGGRNTVAAISVKRCNATTSKGCRANPTTVNIPEAELTVDASTHTLYGANTRHHRIDVFDTTKCNVSKHAHCAPVSSIKVEDPGESLSAVDDATHTLYASDGGNADVSVIDVSACDATTTTGCKSAVKATVDTGKKYGGDLVENPVTHTLYAENGPYTAKPSHVAVLDVSACNGADTSGCAQTPVQVPVGAAAQAIGVSTAANTVYVSESGTGQFGFGDTVAVIDGASCNGTVHAGCGAPVARVKVTFDPGGIVVDDANHTVYAASNADGDSPGDVTVIDSETCNGTTTAGCGGKHATAGSGRSALLAALDPTSHKVYVADFSSAAVSVVNGATCNATKTTGCAAEVPLEAVSSQPFSVAIDTGEHTVYVSTFAGGGTLALLPTG